MEGEKPTPPHEQREEREMERTTTVHEFIKGSLPKYLNYLEGGGEEYRAIFQGEILALLHPAAAGVRLNERQMWYVGNILGQTFNYRVMLSRTVEDFTASNFILSNNAS